MSNDGRRKTEDGKVTSIDKKNNLESIKINKLQTMKPKNQL